MAKKKKKGRRTRSPHAGVVLTKRTRPDGPDRWRARWTDPDTGRVRWETLDAGAHPITTDEGRVTWAINKSKALALRRVELAAGAPRVVEITVPDAVEKYLAVRAADVEDSTLREITRNVRRFEAWAGKAGIRETRDLTPAALADFRDHVFATKKKRIAPGGARGAHERTSKPLSDETRNVVLGHVATMLRDWRRRGYLGLDSDAIADGVRKKKRKTKKVISFLRSAQIRKLLEAALRHDQAVHNLTRKEHEMGLRPGEGRTLKYPASSPFILTVLLTGMRRGEAEGLRWDEVFLDEQALILDADRIKTDEGRRVDLSVSPSLVALLTAMRLRKGKDTYVFPAWRKGGLASATAKRLLSEYGAPKGFTWQGLRRTCSTFSTNAPFLGPWKSSKRLGHSVTIAERHYAGLVQVPDDAISLEKAMGVEDLARTIVERAGGKVASESQENTAATA